MSEVNPTEMRNDTYGSRQYVMWTRLQQMTLTHSLVRELDPLSHRVSCEKPDPHVMSIRNHQITSQSNQDSHRVKHTTRHTNQIHNATNLIMILKINHENYDTDDQIIILT